MVIEVCEVCVSTACPLSNYGSKCQRHSNDSEVMHTSVNNDVLPAPLGPASRKAGRCVVALER